MKKALGVGLMVLGVVVLSVAGFFLLKSRGPKPQVAGLEAPVAVVEPTLVPTQVPKVVLKVFAGSVTVNGATGVDGQEVKVGDSVAAGKDGRGELRYPSGTVTRLDTGAKIVLEQFVASPQQIKVKLDEGRIWNRVTKLLGGEQYQSESNKVVATVRGTSYGQGILADGTNAITALKGTVQSGCNNDSQNEEVTKNEKVEMNCKNGQKAKTTTLTDSEIAGDEWLNFNKDQDKKLEDEIGADKFDDNKVLGVSTEVTETPTPTLTPAPTPTLSEPLISCTGPDGRSLRVTKKVCDDFNASWRPTATPTPSQNTNNNPDPTATPTNMPTPTPTLTPTPTDVPTPTVTDTPTPTPTPSWVISGVEVFDSVGYLSLKIEGLPSQNGSVDVKMTDTSGTLGSFVTTGNFDGAPLYASFSGSNIPPCLHVYTLSVNYQGSWVDWSGTVSDRDRPTSCVQLF